MATNKLLGKVASKLHANYVKQTTGANHEWSPEERRVWIGLARRAAGLFAADTYAPIIEEFRKDQEKKARDQEKKAQQELPATEAEEGLPATEASVDPPATKARARARTA